MLQAPPFMAVIPPIDSTATNTSNSFRGSNSSFSETGDDDDSFVTIETDNDFAAIEPPRPLVEKESMQRDEKQILVDPISLIGSPTIRQASFRLVTPPTAQKAAGMNLPLPLPPVKLKFLSASVPNSAASSPQNSTSFLKKIWKSQNDVSPRPARKLSRLFSAMDDSHLVLQESNMRRSKSMDEGRTSAPADDFDLWLEKPSARDREENNHSNKKQTSRSFLKQETIGNRSKKGKSREIPEDGFKCGKLCLFLPRGKGKPVRSSSAISLSTKTEAPVISRTVSLEKFDCGSWSSSVLMNDNEGDSTNLFFDLPLELIRCSVSDMQSPVTAAFVFDKEEKEDKEPKGVLKSGGSMKGNSSRKSSQDSSGRHVRFSTSSQTSCPSSPMCITPRLRKAREDFNAFLEAQST